MNPAEEAHLRALVRSNPFGALAACERARSFVRSAARGDEHPHVLAARGYAWIPAPSDRHIAPWSERSSRIGVFPFPWLELVDETIELAREQHSEHWLHPGESHDEFVWTNEALARRVREGDDGALFMLIGRDPRCLGSRYVLARILGALYAIQSASECHSRRREFDAEDLQQMLDGPGPHKDVLRRRLEEIRAEAGSERERKQEQAADEARTAAYAFLDRLGRAVAAIGPPRPRHFRVAPREEIRDAFSAARGAFIELAGKFKSLQRLPPLYLEIALLFRGPRLSGPALARQLALVVGFGDRFPWLAALDLARGAGYGEPRYRVAIEELWTNPRAFRRAAEEAVRADFAGTGSDGLLGHEALRKAIFDCD